jgi:hypothetical protein
MTDDDCLERARKEMVKIEEYARDAALRLGIPNATMTWGEGWPLSRAMKTYPMRVTAGEVSKTMEFLLDGLADYPGGRGNAIPKADVDKLLDAVMASLGTSRTTAVSEAN